MESPLIGIRLMSPEPIQHIDALKHIQTLIRMASESNDTDVVRKLLGEMQRIIDKMLLQKRS